MQNPANAVFFSRRVFVVTIKNYWIAFTANRTTSGSFPVEQPDLVLLIENLPRLSVLTLLSFMLQPIFGELCFCPGHLTSQPSSYQNE
jgi:hypothetical protein